MEITMTLPERMAMRVLNMQRMHNVPVKILQKYLCNDDRELYLWFDKNDSTLIEWMKGKATGKTGHLLRMITSDISGVPCEVVATMRQLFMKHAIPVEMTISKTREDKKRDVQLVYIEEDEPFASWMYIYAIEVYLGIRTFKTEEQ